jgi:hypothetical protein
LASLSHFATSQQVTPQCIEIYSPQINTTFAALSSHATVATSEKTPFSDDDVSIQKTDNSLQYYDNDYERSCYVTLVLSFPGWAQFDRINFKSVKNCNCPG